MSWFSIPGPRRTAMFSLAGLAACSGGGGGGGSPPPGTDEPAVSFASAAQSASEADGSTDVVVRLSAPSTQPIGVPLASSGSASSGTHYVLDASQVEVPAGASEAVLGVDLLTGIPLFEPDVELVLELLDPSNAELGDPVVHHLAIRNDDLFVESEPNNEVALANDVGGQIGSGRAGTILGAVVGPTSNDPYDVFAVSALEDVSVALELVPEAVADVSLWISDGTGALTHMFESSGAGGGESGTIEVVADQTFWIVVVSLDVATSWSLSIEGAESLVVSGPSGGGDPLLALGADWDGIVRALRLRKSGPLGPLGLDREFVGHGILIEDHRVREFLLSAPRR